ncbi:major histocompatibility complex class I-related gene protein-like [Anabas testudineus]|nr:major histocompatibility complex class I-related gene protein-like [Anabas testudineus]
MELVFLLSLLPVTHSVKHSLTFFLTTSSGLQTVPEFMAAAVVDGVQVGSCDSTNLNAETKQDWAKELVDDNNEHLEQYTQACTINHPAVKLMLEMLKRVFKHPGGFHVLQDMHGCEQDDNKVFTVFYHLGYNGEHLASLDNSTQTWEHAKLSDNHKNQWDTYFTLMQRVEFLRHTCPQLLMYYLKYGNSTLQRKVLPSVSLLQKTPSSPVSCHATGFYPDRASMFWRKDGEEIHEDVDHGEILPNHDGTFQMRVDLNISSVKPEDWSRYDCVFQISGVKKDVITKLDKAEIRTNWENPKAMIIPKIMVVMGVLGLVLVLIVTTGFVFCKKKAPDSGSLVFQILN